MTWFFKMNRITIFFVPLLLLSIVSCIHKKESAFPYIKGKTGIIGVVTRDGLPKENVEVYLYRNIKSNLRGPADFMDITDVNGRYFIDVPRGSYYIIARKRKSGKTSGPIGKGDYYSEPIYKPIVVLDGRSAQVDLVLKQLSGALIQTESGQKKTDTYISGVIVDKEKKSLQGVYAFAYKDSDLRREPDYFSSETGSDGAFTLYFDKGGKYSLGARSSSRGTPKPGEFYSLYEGPRGNSILVKDNEKITGIKIILREYK